MKVAAHIDVSAPRQFVWDWVADPAHAMHFMSGVTRFEAQHEHQERGLGARYKLLMKVGSAELGGLVEVVEYHPPSNMAWNGVTGVDQRMRFRLREINPLRTHVELRLEYDVAGGGIAGFLAERIAAPIVQGNLRRSVQQLKRAVEQEQRRVHTAERRSERLSAMQR